MAEIQGPGNGVSFSVTVDGDKDGDDWERSDMRLSPSRINMFLKCPRSFYYRYIAKLPETMTIHLFRGSMVHNILEDLFKKKFKYASYWKYGAAKEWVQTEFIFLRFLRSFPLLFYIFR